MRKTRHNGVIVIIDEYGNCMTEIVDDKVKKMMSPVLCNYCNDVYDLTAVKVTHRYADCTTYTTPCCDKMADDRMWVSFPAFKKLDKDL